MPNPSEIKQPKLQGYCAMLYNHMFENSSEEEGYTVWRGKITKTAKDIGIPDGTYKRVMDQLHALKCIEQVERGFRGTAGTTVILLKAPTDEVWQDESTAGDLTRGLSPAILSSRIDDVEGRLGTIDWIKAFGEMQVQIEELKSALLQQNK